MIELELNVLLAQMISEVNLLHLQLEDLFSTQSYLKI